MARMIVLDPYYSDRATLSGGSWALPLANLQDMQPSRTVQSNGVAPASTKIVARFAEAVRCTALTLGRHNLSSTAMVRNIAGNDLYDLAFAPWFNTGWLSVWPSSGKPTDRGVTWYDMFKLLAPTMAYRWWRIEIDDSANAAGFLEIGRLYLGTYWQPPVNYSKGRDFGRLPIDVRMVTDYGHTLTDKRVAPRSWTLPLDFLKPDDAETAIYEMQRELGTANDVFVVLNPDDTTLLHRRSMMATLAEVPTVVQPYANTYRTTLKWTELR